MDFIQSLGSLMLDHRLKRLVNHLLAEAERVYQELDLPFKPRWVSTYMLLASESPLTVTEISERIRMSHPAVIQITRDMIEYKIARSTPDEKDARRRLLLLTPKGKRLEPVLQDVWKALASAQEGIFRKAGWDVPAMLDRIDETMEQRSIAEVTLARIRRRAATARRR